MKDIIINTEKMNSKEILDEILIVRNFLYSTPCVYEEMDVSVCIAIDRLYKQFNSRVPAEKTESTLTKDEVKK